MINKNELRIGSLVWHVLLGESMILELRNDGISICNPKNKMNAYFIPNENLYKIDPIETNDEFLLKLGFEEIDSDYEYAETIDYFLDPLYFDIANRSVKINGVYQKIEYPEYIHQLQNLYFSLSGKELETIKP